LPLGLRRSCSGFLLQEAGKTFAAIAEELNRDLVPTAHGGAKWYPSTVRAVLASA